MIEIHLVLGDHIPRSLVITLKSLVSLKTEHSESFQHHTTQPPSLVQSPRFPTPVVALRSDGLSLVSHPGWRVAQRAGASNGAVSGLCRAANEKLGKDMAKAGIKPIQSNKFVGEWLSFEVWNWWHMMMMFCYS